MNLPRKIFDLVIISQSAIGQNLRKWTPFLTDAEWEGLSKRYIFRAIAGIVVLGIILATTYYRNPFQMDDAFTANAVTKPWNEMFQGFWQDPVAPLHYILLKDWVVLFGDSVTARRSLSSIFLVC